jgi:hypothetical protein
LLDRGRLRPQDFRFGGGHVPKTNGLVSAATQQLSSGGIPGHAKHFDSGLLGGFGARLSSHRLPARTGHSDATMLKYLVFGTVGIPDTNRAISAGRSELFPIWAPRYVRGFSRVS